MEKKSGIFSLVCETNNSNLKYYILSQLHSYKTLISSDSYYIFPEGETYLEIAMALETVDRTDEAREIYGKLVTINWSQKTKRNALQLLQGLDITMKIRQQVINMGYIPYTSI